MWQIVPQDTKDGAVDVKRVKFYPIVNKRTKEVVGFGRLGMSCLRLIFRHSSMKDYEHYMVTCTMRFVEDQTAPINNKGQHPKKPAYFYNITCPKRLVPKSRWDNEMVLVPGRSFGGKPTSGSMQITTFTRELSNIVGVEFAQIIIDNFEYMLEEAA